MINKRIIPCLQLVENSLVKTVKFKNQVYIGDSINTIRIFNEIGVDEICFLDIRATINNQEPNFKILKEIANECFIPLSYGGGIKNLDTVKKILAIGFEKIIINSAIFSDYSLVEKISSHIGSSSLICSIDLKKNFFGKYNIFSHSGTIKKTIDPITLAKRLEDQGAGELLVTSINNEGTWKGLDENIIEKIANSVNIPVIANGGAGNKDHVKILLNNTNVSAVCVGSMVVFQNKGMGVLINFPFESSLNN